MIGYATFCQLRLHHDRDRMSASQIAQRLNLDEKTVAKWILQTEYRPRQKTKRPSKLDAHKAAIVRLLETHPYSAVQILQRIREQGYDGGYSILKQFIHQVRPPRRPAFLTLAFAPGECAQLDWGSFGSIRVGATQRRLSFLVMVLCYSRLMYVEFALAQTMEQFLAAQQHAFEFFGGVPRAVMIDNLKSGVLDHPLGQPAVFHPRYLDFAAHHGFQIKACGVHKANEKGRVENGVGYVKKNFLNGLPLSEFASLNPAVRLWLGDVANVRVHGETHKKPIELFAEEKPKLLALPTIAYDGGILQPVRATSRFRVVFETNRYSVPAEYASASLTLKITPERLWIYQQEKLIAEHVRGYDRHQDFENPDHVRALLAQRRNAREQQLFARFLALSPKAAEYHRQLECRRLNPRHHLQKIVALGEIYGTEALARALEDAFTYQAFSCEYVANILEQRVRQLPQAGALHLTRRQDLLDLDLPPADLSIYDRPSDPPNPTTGEIPCPPQPKV